MYASVDQLHFPGHDLLFDSGLLLRPRPKREQSEKYWAALWEEVQTGCTCATVDEEGRERPTQCVCATHRAPETGTMVVPLEGNARTFRMPSRLPGLLKEFLEVMVFVIQPLNNTAVYTNPNAIQAQAQQHAAHAAYLRSVFDPQLIEQQLKYGIFDAAVLFTRIGQTLKQHCAPMRDRAVEDVIRQSQRPGAEALKAFRMGLELLELMKLVCTVVAYFGSLLMCKSSGYCEPPTHPAPSMATPEYRSIRGAGLPSQVWPGRFITHYSPMAFLRSSIAERAKIWIHRPSRTAKTVGIPDDVPKPTHLHVCSQGTF